MQPLLLLATGAAIGCLGTLLGLGGGFILVPILLYAFRFPQPIAVGTSHVVICLNAVSGAIAYDRQRKIDYDLALCLAVPAIPASAFASAFIVPRFQSPWFLVAFAGILVFGAVYVMQRGKLADLGSEREPSVRARWVCAGLSLVSGVAAATLGVGGGVFYVPMLAILLGRPFHRATATSVFVLLLSSLVAAAVLVWRGQVDVTFALWLGLGVIAGAQAGARLATRLNNATLRAVFAGAV
ncbi:MAG: sulfite exporter TauE/SafE family protein, partial [Candidatus Brocadiae bacterium]|nr:sulfite exporter TauE/SafE family protein [Candidatus Brocadiia bacterium]